MRTKVRDNIELDLLCRNQPESAPVMQEIYELVVETIQLAALYCGWGNNLFPMALVRERLLQRQASISVLSLTACAICTRTLKSQEISSDDAVQCACHTERQDDAGCTQICRRRIPSDAGVTPRRYEQIVKFEKVAEIFNFSFEMTVIRANRFFRPIFNKLEVKFYETSSYPLSLLWLFGQRCARQARFMVCPHFRRNVPVALPPLACL